MKHLKKFEDVYYPEKPKNRLKEFRPTDEQVENLEYLINSRYKEELELKDDFIITHIEYYEWDEKPRWYVTLINEAKLELRYLLEQRKKKIPFPERNLKGETIDEAIDRLRKKARYIELDVYPGIYGDKDPIEIIKIEYAGHGSPCISEEIWQIDYEK